MPYPLYLLLNLSSKSIFKLCLKSHLIFQNKNIFSIKMVDLVTLQESVRDFHVCVWEIVRMSVCKIECIRVCVRERESERVWGSECVSMCESERERESEKRGRVCEWLWVSLCVCVCLHKCVYVFVRVCESQLMSRMSHETSTLRRSKWRENPLFPSSQEGTTRKEKQNALFKVER